jgi:hypothetical protein
MQEMHGPHAVLEGGERRVAGRESQVPEEALEERMKQDDAGAGDVEGRRIRLMRALLRRRRRRRDAEEVGQGGFEPVLACRTTLSSRASLWIHGSRLTSS